METLKNIWNIILSFFVNNGGTLLYCACFALGGWLIQTILCKLVRRAIRKTEKLSDKAEKIITILIKTAVWTIVGLVVLGALNVPVTAIVTLFSAVGLSLSLAAKDTLSNFAKGFQLLLTRPFKTGDYIEINGVTGSVKSIELVYTRLATDDNKIILIPNSQISDEQIINYSAQEIRRLDLDLAFDCSENIEKAKSILQNVVDCNDAVLASPSPIIRIKSYHETCIHVAVWVWTKREHFAELRFDLNEQIGQAFKDGGICFPCIRKNIHIVGGPPSSAVSFQQSSSE